MRRSETAQRFVAFTLAVTVTLGAVTHPVRAWAQTAPEAQQEGARGAAQEPAWARVDRRRTAWPTVGIVMATVGLAATIAGGAMWLVADSRFGDCQATGCRLDDQPRDLDLAGVVTFWSGVGLTAAGILTYYVGRSNRRAFAFDTTPRPFVGPGLVGLSGRF